MSGWLLRLSAALTPRGVGNQLPPIDLPLMHRYQVTPAQYADILIDQFDEMLVQSRDTPLVFCLSFHPYFAGDAFRLKHLRRVYQHMMSHVDRIWFAKTGDIAKHIASLPPGLVPGS